MEDEYQSKELQNTGGVPAKHPGGRPKGSPNKDKAKLREKAERLGVDPFEILLLFAKADWKALGYPAQSFTKEMSGGIVNEELYITPAIRSKAAAEACQYLEPKLKAIEHTGDREAKVALIMLPRNGKERLPEPEPSNE